MVSLCTLTMCKDGKAGLTLELEGRVGGDDRGETSGTVG